MIFFHKDATISHDFEALDVDLTSGYAFELQLSTGDTWSLSGDADGVLTLYIQNPSVTWNQAKYEVQLTNTTSGEVTYPYRGIIWNEDLING